MCKMFRLSNFTIMYVLLLSNRFVESQFASNYTVVPPFRVQKIAEDVPLARTILQDEAGDLLVVASGSSQIYSLYETTHGDGTVTINKVIILDRPDLEFNHGMTYKNGFLYVSNPRAVYRWPYKAGLRAPITAREEVVISNIPFRQSEKGYKDPHITRTIIFDKEGRLLVQVGAGDNIDVDSSRCRIRRFELPDPLPFGGLNFDSGIIFADGLRNTVGLGWDLKGTLWGVGNAGDGLDRPDLDENVGNENPAEELNRFDQSLGSFYGYPYCFASYNISGYEENTPFAWPSFLNDGTHTDDWCQNPDNNVRPALALPGHEAPLSIEFYDGRGCDVNPGALPCSETGNAIVTFHGSYFKEIPGGFSVTLISFDQIIGSPLGNIRDLIVEEDRMKCKLSGIADCFRPVSAIVDNQGRIVFTADYSGEVFRLFYNYDPPALLLP